MRMHLCSEHGQKTSRLDGASSQPAIECGRCAHARLKSLREGKHAWPIESFLRGKHGGHARQVSWITCAQPARGSEIASRAKCRHAFFIASSPAAFPSHAPIGSRASWLGRGRNRNKVRDQPPVPLNGDSPERGTLEHLAQAVLQLRGFDNVHSQNNMLF